MDFTFLLSAAKAGDMESTRAIVEMYRPLLARESIVDGFFDEDLFQELNIVLLHCIKLFSIQR